SYCVKSIETRFAEGDIFMSWTQTLVAAVLTAALLFGGVVGLAVWAAPSWAGAFWSEGHAWRDSGLGRGSRWHGGELGDSRSARLHDICDRIGDFDVVFLRDYLAGELDLNATQKADFNALVVAFTKSAERLQTESCTMVSNSRPLPERFMHYARTIDHASEEMHALTSPLTRFYQGLSEDQRRKLDVVMEHRRGHR
ncbi:MAG: Spy/CpxP family protein refolding chaperone, partial [Fimbriimonadaceae bacterium]|nr:Spy/CpxP family protein refolding chaperone [Alphaproteobacteria bacterium]